MSLFKRGNGTREYNTEFVKVPTVPVGVSETPTKSEVAETLRQQPWQLVVEYTADFPSDLSNDLKPNDRSFDIIAPIGVQSSPDFIVNDGSGSVRDFFKKWTNMLNQEKTAMQDKAKYPAGKEYVFLGGTCGGSAWREELIPRFNQRYFNPVVKDWKPEDIFREEVEKQAANILLYAITSKQEGFYSLVEMAVSALKNPDKTIIIAFLEHDGPFTGHALKSNLAIAQLLGKEPNVKVFYSIEAIGIYLNSRLAEKVEDN